MEIFKSRRERNKDRLDFFRSQVRSEIFEGRISCWLFMVAFLFVLEFNHGLDGNGKFSLGMVLSILATLHYRRWGDYVNRDRIEKSCLFLAIFIIVWTLQFLFFCGYPPALIFLFWGILPGWVFFCVVKRHPVVPVYRKSYSGALSIVAPETLRMMRKLNVAVGRIRDMQTIYILILKYNFILFSFIYLIQSVLIRPSFYALGLYLFFLWWKRGVDKHIKMMKEGEIYTLLRSEGYNSGISHYNFCKQILLNLCVLGYVCFISSCTKYGSIFVDPRLAYGWIIYGLTYSLLAVEVRSQVALQEYRKTVKEI